jgi:MFS transporter, DHA1 family, tetracycline resistance protein
VMTLLAVGSGLIRPANLGLISIISSKKEQGMVMGITQSLSSLGRVVGPPMGGWLYQTYNPASPFVVSAGLSFVCFLLLVSITGAIKKMVPKKV